jgi:hypothetical protein
MMAGYRENKLSTIILEHANNELGGLKFLHTHRRCRSFFGLHGSAENIRQKCADGKSDQGAKQKKKGRPMLFLEGTTAAEG